MHTPFLRAARLLAAALILALLLAGALPAHAQQPGFASSGEQIRQALFDAQMALERDPARAAEHFAAAQAALQTLIPQLPTEAQAAVNQTLQQAAEAQQAADPVAFAAARAAIWTSLLNGSLLAVYDAVRAGDGSGAAAWLTLREYRQATRIGRPGADASLAVDALAAGASLEETLVAVDADLLDAYQARLHDALDDLTAAESSGFAQRRAAAAGLAEGYFAMLAPAFALQRGDQAAADAQVQFAQLRSEAAAGRSVLALLPAVETTLQGFRAAPLSAREEQRRAGQLFRYLPLVPVEYGRGVQAGRVTLDLEIREAITFAEGAAQAFEALRSVLDELDAPRTAQLADQLQALQADLAAAAAGTAVAEPAAIRAQAEAALAAAQELFPAEWQVREAAADFDMVQLSLDQMQVAVAEGNYSVAESARLDAYAMLESGPEARLTAFAPQYVPVLEGLFWQGYEEHGGLAHQLATEAPAREIAATRVALDEQLALAQDAIGGQMAPQAVASNAGLIVFREGLEAVLILASLLASLRIGTQRKMRQPLWSGVLLAMVATVITWYVARGAVASLARYGERLEAVVSLIAVAMLLLILNWFFHDFYWKDWMAGFHQRKKRIITGSASQWLGLVVLGFTSVYREGFETVIFLQALVLEAGTPAVMTGVGAGLALTALLGLLVFGLQARLPHKKMLVVTGVLIGAVLLQMVGNMVHTFQVVGWLPTHPIRWLNMPYWMGVWFGLYPTIEGLGLQLAAAIFTIGSYVAAERMQGRKLRFWPGSPRRTQAATPAPHAQAARAPHAHAGHAHAGHAHAGHAHAVHTHAVHAQSAALPLPAGESE